MRSFSVLSNAGFIFILFSVCSGSVYSGVEPLPDDLRYSGELSAHASNDTDALESRIEDELARDGFIPFQSRTAESNSFLWVDQAFWNPDTGRFILFKFHLALSVSRHQGILYRHPQGYLFHGETASRTGYAVFYSNGREEEALELNARIARVIGEFSPKTALQSSRSDRLLAALLSAVSPTVANAAMGELPQACASGTPVLGTPAMQGVEAGQAAADGYILRTFIPAAMSCARGLLQGAWDGTGGRVKGAWSFTKKLFSEPGKLWDSAVEQFKSLKDLILNLRQEAINAFKAVRSMTAEAAAGLVCNMLSGIGVSAVMAAITGGAAAAGVALLIQGYVKKMKMVASVLEKMESMASLKEFEQIRAKIMKGLGKQDEKQLQTGKDLEQEGFSDLALGAIQCGI